MAGLPLEQRLLYKGRVWEELAMATGARMMAPFTPAVAKCRLRSPLERLPWFTLVNKRAF
jgi:hypothetical protein